MGNQAQPPPKALQELIESFDNSPANSGRQIRELLDRDRAAFLPAALACLRQNGDSRAYRYLVTLLAGNDVLVKCICEPSLGMSAAVALARAAIKVNPALDAALAREVTKCVYAGSGDDERAIRMLEILGAISNGRRLLPLLTTLLQYPNPRVRSKVALLMGLRTRTRPWIEQRKEEADPRVRANAVEGLWDSADEGVGALLWEASQDPHNRVAGNALIGLYRLGDVRAIGSVLEMAGHSEARFRATAAWVMGQSRDPRFLATLGRMLADPEKMVRARSFRALACVRERVARLTPTNGIRVHFWEARLLTDGWRRLRLAVVDGDGGVPLLTATQFLVTEGNEAVTHYEMRRRPASVPLAVGWGFPRGLETASGPITQILRECLRHKRAPHTWSILPYNPHYSFRAEAYAAPEPRFTGNPAILAALLELPATRLHAARAPLDAARLLVSATAPLPGERHLVLISSRQDHGGPAKDLEGVAEKARNHGVSIHGLALSRERFPWLESLCAATGGRLLHAATDEETRTAVWRIFWGLHYQEEIHYWLDKVTPDQRLVRVQVHSDLGIADDALSIES